MTMKSIDEYQAFDETDFIACLLMIGPPARKEGTDWARSLQLIGYYSLITDFFKLRFTNDASFAYINGAINFRDDYLEWLKEKQNG